MNRVETVRLQLRAVAALRVLKRTRTYEELAADTGLPAGDCNRYVNGHVLPGVERARAVLDEVTLPALREELRARVRVDDAGYVDTSRVVFDQPLLGLVAPAAAEAHAFDPPDAVLTAATDGITVGAALAAHYDARCVYAKEKKETAVAAFHEARHTLESGIDLTYYLPESALEAGDRVLVADDLIRSGETQELLLELADAAGATVSGVFTLIAVGDVGVDRARARTDAPVRALLSVE
ncbi:MAG: phosphoribosyltransferase family protein [Halobacteriaceae archaeon]